MKIYEIVSSTSGKFALKRTQTWWFIKRVRYLSLAGNGFWVKNGSWNFDFCWAPFNLVKEMKDRYES